MSLPTISILYASFKIEDVVLFKKNIEHDSNNFATFKIMPASRKDKLLEEIEKGYDIVLVDQGFTPDFTALWKEIQAVNKSPAPVFILNLKTSAEHLLELGYMDVLPGPIDFGMLSGKIKSLTGKEISKSIPNFQTKSKAKVIVSPLFEIQSITDQEVVVETSTAFEVGKNTKLHSGSFEWTQGPVLTKVVSCTPSGKGFITRFSFLNLDLETVRTLRKWIMKEYNAQKAS